MNTLRYFASLLIIALGSLSISADVLSFGKSVSFNDGWKFSLTPDSIAPASTMFDDSGWRNLSLPHDWSIEQLPSPYLNACTGFFPGGTGWYRKTFFVPDNEPVHYLYFEGVYNRSEIFLNGEKIGERPNGYASFYLDISPYLKEGKNILAVRVDHSREADSRWYTGSGIYRDVYLVSAPAVHFSPWGIGWKAKNISAKSAEIAVDYSLDGFTSGKALKLTATLENTAGQIVATAVRNVNSPSGKLSLRVRNPKLWSPATPALYRLELQLLDNGNPIDSSSCNVGIRSLRFDPDRGFFLNDSNMKVKGVCLHHDAGVLGSVVPPEVWERRLRNLKDIGVNAIRMSHNPQAPALYDLCDRLGFLVMDEARDEWEFPKRKWVTGWNVGVPKFEGSYDFFEEWIERDVADMVRRDRNHPSVVFWSIGNEVDYPNDPYSHPILDHASISQHNYGGYNPDAPSAMRIGEIAKRLADVVRSVDDSRPVTGALAGVVMSNETAYPDAVDIVGYNYTENRYQSDHHKYPRRVIYGSENTHDYQAWKAVEDNDHIFGQFLWTGIDYLGESNVWPSRGLGSGLLDFGGFMKPRGKFRASLWSDKPVAFLGAIPQSKAGQYLAEVDAPAVWNFSPDEKVRVVCFTNASSARLLLDDEPYGEIKSRDPETGVIFWDLAYRPGTLTAEALNDKGSVIASDTISTTGPATSLRVTTAPGSSPDAPVKQVMLELLDADGNLATLADNLITVSLNGTGEILGVEGTGNTDMSHPKALSRRPVNGRILLYFRSGNNPSAITFSSPLLPSSSIIL